MVSLSRELLSLTTKTASFNSNTLDVSWASEVMVMIRTANVSGTNPTLDATIQYSYDRANWFDGPSFTQFTAAGSELQTHTPVGPYMRIAVTIGGTTPSFDVEIQVKAKS